MHNKSRILPLCFRPNNFSTSLILHLPTEHTCIGVNDGTLLRSEEGFARREPGLWSSCPGSLSMPWQPEGTSSTCASLHWLPTSAFTLPGTSTKVCVRGPGCQFASVVPIAGTTIIYVVSRQSAMQLPPRGDHISKQFRKQIETITYKSKV